MLLAVVPVVVPVLAALVVVGAGVGLYLWASDSGGELGGGDKPGELPPGTDKPSPGAPKELVESLTGTYQDGKFHETKSGDSIAKLAFQTVKGISPTQANSPQVVGAVRTILNMSGFNRALFGEEIDGDNYLVDGVAINRFAMPKHEPTIDTMELGFYPVRNIDASGKRIGPSQRVGDPYIPKLNHDAVKDGISDPALLLAAAYPDGTPSTEPPPELMAVLEQRA